MAKSANGFSNASSDVANWTRWDCKAGIWNSSTLRVWQGGWMLTTGPTLLERLPRAQSQLKVTTLSRPSVQPMKSRRPQLPPQVMPIGSPQLGRGYCRACGYNFRLTAASGGLLSNLGSMLPPLLAILRLATGRILSTPEQTRRAFRRSAESDHWSACLCRASE